MSSSSSTSQALKSDWQTLTNWRPPSLSLTQYLSPSRIRPLTQSSVNYLVEEGLHPTHPTPFPQKPPRTTGCTCCLSTCSFRSYCHFQYLYLQYLYVQYSLLQYLLLRHFFLGYLLLEYLPLEHLLLEYLLLQALLSQYLFLRYLFLWFYLLPDHNSSECNANNTQTDLLITTCNAQHSLDRTTINYCYNDSTTSEIPGQTNGRRQTNTPAHCNQQQESTWPDSDSTDPDSANIHTNIHTRIHTNIHT